MWHHRRKLLNGSVELISSMFLCSITRLSAIPSNKETRRISCYCLFAAITPLICSTHAHQGIVDVLCYCSFLVVWRATTNFIQSKAIQLFSAWIAIVSLVGTVIDVKKLKNLLISIIWHSNNKTSQSDGASVPMAMELRIEVPAN